MSCRAGLVGSEGFQDVGNRGQCGGFSGGDEFIGAGEVVPDEGLYVGFNDDVGLRAPSEVGMVLDDGEGAADDIGGGAGRGEAAGFEIDTDGDVGAEQAGTFNGDGSGEEAVDEGATFELDRDEEAGIGAGAAQGWSNRAAGVIDGDAGVNVGGGDGEGRGEFLECSDRSEALEVALEAKIVGQAEPGRRPAAEVGKGSERGDALHVVERDAGAIDGADERANAGAGDAIDGHAGVEQRADNADVGDAAGEASGEGKSNAGAVTVGARLSESEGANAIGCGAQPLFGEGDLVGTVVRIVGHSDYSLVPLAGWARLFDRRMLVL